MKKFRPTVKAWVRVGSLRPGQAFSFGTDYTDIYLVVHRWYDLARYGVNLRRPGSAMVSLSDVDRNLLVMPVEVEYNFPDIPNKETADEA